LFFVKENGVFQSTFIDILKNVCYSNVVFYISRKENPMKKLFSLMLCLALALTLTACGGSEPAATEAPAEIATVSLTLLSSEIRNNGEGTDETKLEYVYDEKGVCTEIISYLNGKEVLRAAPKYDEAGNILEKTYANFGNTVVETYTYDENGKVLTFVQATPEGNVIYQYEDVPHETEEFAKRTMTNFMTNELSSYYCDFAKDILYCDRLDSSRRRKIQSVLYKATEYLVKLWSPILAFTCDEVWSHFNSNEADSVHYTHFPEIEEYADQDLIRDNFRRLHEIRSDIFKAREEAINAKIIEKPMQAHALLHVSDEDRKLLTDAFGDKINQWLIIAKVLFVDEELTKYDNVEVKIEMAKGHVCPRCWNIVEEENEDGLCDRCADALK